MSSVSCWRNASFAFSLITFVAFVVAFSAPCWGTTFIFVWGLWRVCFFTTPPTQCTTFVLKSDGTASQDTYVLYMTATRALMCLSLTSQIVSLIIYCRWCGKKEPHSRGNVVGTLGKLALSLVFLGGVFNLTAVGVFRKLVFDTVGIWCYWCACATSGALLLNSVATLIATRCCSGSGSRGSPPSTDLPVAVVAGQPPAPMPLTAIHQTPEGVPHHVTPLP